jgi:hypothetical protein
MLGLVLLVPSSWDDYLANSNGNATMQVQKEAMMVSTPSSVVAHCITGQARTMDHPMIYQNFRDHVLHRIGAPSDVYFVIDHNRTTSIDLYHPKKVHIIEKVDSQYERWLICMGMILEAEATESIKYSHVIINRPDQVVLQDVPPIENFPNHSVWVKPYGEFMDEYNSTMLLGDDTALQAWESHPVHGKQALSDLFIVLPRPVAHDFVESVVEDIDCGNHTKKDVCGDMAGHGECRIKCALAAHAIPYVYQNFQLRILRPHARRKCPVFGKVGKDYNSMCI